MRAEVIQAQDVALAAVAGKAALVDEAALAMPARAFVGSKSKPSPMPLPWVMIVQWPNGRAHVYTDSSEAWSEAKSRGVYVYGPFDLMRMIAWTLDGASGESLEAWGKRCVGMDPRSIVGEQTLGQCFARAGLKLWKESE